MTTHRGISSSKALRSLCLAGVYLAVVLAGPSVITMARREMPTIPVSDVKPGMTGFGLSVFRGTVPERFDVEVIDVLHNFRAGQDLILIRTPHPLLDHTQAVAGMSGSPIYLDGKLAGAYAYGWPFGRDPVVGVTPIADMLAELARPVDPKLFRLIGPVPQQADRAPGARQARAARNAAHRQHLAQGPLAPLRSHERRDALWALRSLNDQPHRRTSPTRTQPAQTPVMLSGMTDGVTDLLERELSPLGLLPLQAGGAGSAAERPLHPAPYVNGGAIGVQLIRGDMSATGVGTVTHVDGRRLIAFGHPMMNVGQTAMPTTTAEVVHVLASMQRSFKMARPVSPVGTLIHDRQSAIVVDTELTPTTIPVHLSVHEPQLRGAAAPKHEWQFEVASHRALAPVLILTALINGLQATLADRTEAIVKAKTTISVSDHGRFEFNDTAFFPGGVADPRGLGQLRLFSAIEAVYGNDFERADITAIEVELDVQFSDAVAEVMAVRVPYSKVDPGSTVPAIVTLRRFDGDEYETALQVRVPKSAAGQHMELEVGSGFGVQPELPIPRNLQDLLAGLRHAYPENSLLMTTTLPSHGMKMRGHLLPQLPDSMLAALHTESSSQRHTPYHHETLTEKRMDRIIYGSAKVQLDVREEAQ